MIKYDFTTIFSNIFHINVIVIFFSSANRISYFRFMQITNLINLLSNSSDCRYLKYAAIDCESFPITCELLGVFSTPRLLIVNNMLKLTQYNGDFSINDLSNYFSDNIPCLLNISGSILESADDDFKSYINMDKCILFHNYFIDPLKAMLDVCNSFGKSLYVKCVFNDLYRYMDIPTPFTPPNSFYFRCNKSIKEITVKDINNHNEIYDKVRDAIDEHYLAVNSLIMKYVYLNQTIEEVPENFQGITTLKEMTNFIDVINQLGYMELLQHIDRTTGYILAYNSTLSNVNYIQNLKYRLILMKTLFYVKFKKDYW